MNCPSLNGLKKVYSTLAEIPQVLSKNIQDLAARVVAFISSLGSRFSMVWTWVTPVKPQDNTLTMQSPGSLGKPDSELQLGEGLPISSDETVRDSGGSVTLEEIELCWESEKTPPEKNQWLKDFKVLILRRRIPSKVFASYLSLSRMDQNKINKIKKIFGSLQRLVWLQDFCVRNSLIARKEASGHGLGPWTQVT